METMFLRIYIFHFLSFAIGFWHEIEESRAADVTASLLTYPRFVASIPLIRQHLSTESPLK